MDPECFYMMDKSDFFLKRDGWLNSRDKFREDLRWAVTPIVSAWVKGFNPQRHMPLFTDKKVKKGKDDRSILQQMRDIKKQVSAIPGVKKVKK